MSPSNSDKSIDGLEPEAVWSFFAQLSQYPRPSKKEGKVLDWLKAFAAARQLEWKQDNVGNLVIRRPGSGGGQAAPTVIIQGHVDMVCEKNDSSSHNFETDPILLRRDGDWIKAQGTTLGSDNGLGVATALAVLDLPPSTKLPPLECLFTVDEETGLTGAFGISGDLLTGRTMLNLDTEDWGELFIGCAGGGDSKIQLQVEMEPIPPNTVVHKLTVEGLLGGHSGLNIHEGRGNAVQILAHLVRGLRAALPGVRVVALKGGDKRNAIAREAQGTLAVPQEKVEEAITWVQRRAAELAEEYGVLEKGLSVRLAAMDIFHSSNTPSVITESDTTKLLTLITGLPHGPLKFSHSVQGLVETSNNVASVHPTPTQQEVPSFKGHSATDHQSPSVSPTSYLIVTTTRSSLNSGLESVRDTIEDLAHLAGGTVEKSRAYPGWQPRLDSPVLKMTQEAFREITDGKEAKVGAIHAGLECGILGEKFPGMDTVSFGPTIKGAHSPDEALLIPTVAPFYQLTLRVLSKLANVR